MPTRLRFLLVAVLATVRAASAGILGPSSIPAIRAIDDAAALAPEHANTACTYTSFSEPPEWRVADFTFDSDFQTSLGPGTVGTVSFTLTNLRNEVPVTCRAGSGESVSRESKYKVRDGRVWYDCNGDGGQSASAIKTSFSFDKDTRNLSINQSWVCDDKDPTHPITFVAVGSATLPDLVCREIAGKPTSAVRCDPVASAFVTGSLVGPVAITPVRSTTLPQRDGAVPGCTDYSASTSWQLGWFTHRVVMTGRDGLAWGAQPVYDGLLNFTLTNPAIQYTVNCVGWDRRFVSDYYEELEDPWMACQPVQPEYSPKDGVFTDYWFNPRNGVFGIRQSWYCNDKDRAHPTAFTATAEIQLAGDCNTPIDDGYLEVFYPVVTACRYRSPGPSIMASITSSQNLTETEALVKFKKEDYSCTVSSFAYRAWKLRGFLADKVWWLSSPDEIAKGQRPPDKYDTFAYIANMWLYNVRTVCDTGTLGNQSSPTGWIKCGYRDGDFMFVDGTWLGDASFQIDYVNKWVAIKQTWRCSDRNPSRPISFSAFGNGTFTESDCSTQRRTRYERVFDKSIPAEAERCSLAGVISMSEFNATQG